MKIVIPALNEDCPAANSLAREGLLFDIVIMEDDLDYGRLWTELWNIFDGFIIVEHDVVPWPGALYRLMECNRHWCSYMYPAAPHNLTNALGCIKIGATLPHNYPDLAKQYNWTNTPWNRLDGAVMSALFTCVPDSHVHTPPVAHAKR